MNFSMPLLYLSLSLLRSVLKYDSKGDSSSTCGISNNKPPFNFSMSKFLWALFSLFLPPSLLLDLEARPYFSTLSSCFRHVAISLLPYKMFSASRKFGTSPHQGSEMWQTFQRAWNWENKHVLWSTERIHCCHWKSTENQQINKELMPRVRYVQ